jgi:hypothetical protein
LRTHSATPPVRVPANALIARSGGNFVFIIRDDGTLEEKNVTLGRELGAEAEVVLGLAGTEKVVTNPAESLVSGEKVRLAEKKAPPQSAPGK